MAVEKENYEFISTRAEIEQRVKDRDLKQGRKALNFNRPQVKKFA